jgi:hypothetical protein
LFKAGAAKHALMADNPIARQVLEGCCTPALSFLRLLDVSVACVVNFLLVDLRNKHQMASVVLLALQVELVLLGVGPGCKVLHLAPQMTGGRQLDFVRHLGAKP